MRLQLSVQEDPNKILAEFYNRLSDNMSSKSDYAMREKKLWKIVFI